MTDAEKHRQGLLVETAIDMGITAGALLVTNRIVCEDSRDLVASISMWADEFTDWFAEMNQDNADYIGEVDKFAEQELLGRYGRNKCTNK